MKGISKNDAPLLILCAAAIAFAAVYILVWNKGNTEAKKLSKQNAQLQTEVDDLTAQAMKKQFYEDEALRMREEINAIYSYFPADVLLEDGIASAMELEAEAPMASGSIGYSPAVTIYTVGDGKDTGKKKKQASAKDEGNGDETLMEEGYGPISLRDSVFTYNFTTSYSGFKNIVGYFATLPDRSTITSVQLGFDGSTGLLNGSATVNRYSLTGTGRTYSPPTFPAVNIGRPNIFGSMEMSPGKPTASGNEAEKDSEGSGDESEGSEDDGEDDG